MRKAIGLAALLGLCAAMAANAGAGQDSGSAPAAAAKAKTIKVWTNDAHNRDEYTKAVEAFNNGKGKELGIVIDYKVYGSDYYTVLDLAISAGEEPYIFKDAAKLPQRYQDGLILPYTELPGLERKIARYMPTQNEGQTVFGGVPYALNVMSTGFCAMFYNKPLLQKAGIAKVPSTWEEFEKACIAVSKVEPGKTYGMTRPLKYSNAHTNYELPAMVPSYGKFYFDFSTGRYCFSDFLEYFQMIQRIIKAGGMMPGVETMDDDTARALFSEGNLGFIFPSPSFNVGVAYDQFPAKMDWGCAPIPVKDPNKSYNPMGGTASNYGISRKAKKDGVLKEVAVVYDYLTSDEILAEMYTKGKNLPVLPEILDIAKPSTRPQWNELAQLSKGQVIRPNFPDVFFSVEGDSVLAAFTKIYTGGDPKAILADLDKRYNEAMDKAIARGTIKKADFIKPEIAERFKKK